MKSIEINMFDVRYAVLWGNHKSGCLMNSFIYVFLSIPYQQNKMGSRKFQDKLKHSSGVYFILS